jgi:hypothetical protein
MGWKPITIIGLGDFQRCLAEKHVPAQYLDEIGQCFEATFKEGEPEPPPAGEFAPCGDNVSQRGTGAWDEWCVDEQRNFVSGPGGVMEMESNAQATRSRLPGTTGRGVAPPTVDSNRVVMTCDLMFPEDWLRPLSLGGQHLFVFGEGPFRLPSGGVSDDHIRFDFGCFDVGGGNGFRDGFRVLIYEKRVGSSHREIWFPSSTRMPGIFRAGVWTPVRADGRYDPATGQCSLDLTIGMERRQITATVSAGIRPHLGDSIGWGNVDQRDGRVSIRNLRYSTA